MLLNEFFLDKAKYKSMSLIERMLYDLIAYEANWIFADTVIDILVKRNPDYRDDPNEKCRMDGFCADRETAWTGKWYLQRLFESEYGELTDALKANIKEIATEYANIPLVKFGWIEKEEEK